MINIDFTNIDNAKLIGHITPFWLRGKRTLLLMLSLFQPIVSVHETFKAWALERYIKAHITSQKKSLAWYLTYKLRKHFTNENDVFVIADVVFSADNIIFRANESEEKMIRYTMPIYRNEESAIHKDREMIIYHEGEVIESNKNIQIFAPGIPNTGIYDENDYIRDIKTIVKAFLTNGRIYNIIINN